MFINPEKALSQVTRYAPKLSGKVDFDYKDSPKYLRIFRRISNNDPEEQFIIYCLDRNKFKLNQVGLGPNNIAWRTIIITDTLDDIRDYLMEWR